MKNKFLIKNIILFTLTLASCDDELFLDRRPIDFVSPENFDSGSQISAALNGTYRALTLADGLYESNTWPIYLDFMVDNGFMDKTWSGEVDFWDQSQGPNSLYTTRKWERNYRGILRANTVLKYIDQVDMEEELKTQYTGEARFLRALFYSDLVEFYGDVPLRLEPEGIDKQHKAKTPKDELLEFILAEFDLAAEELPVSYASADDLGRATKGAALGLKARVLLYNKRWAECAEACKAVMDLGAYELYDDYQNLFTPIGEGVNKEVMFDIQHVATLASDRLVAPWTTYLQLWQSYMATYNLVSDYYMQNGLPIDDPNSGYDDQDPFADRDPRLEMTLITPFSFRNESRITGRLLYFDPCSEKANNFTGLKIKKYVDYNDEFPNTKSSGSNNVIIRYADILLMRAEALIELPDWSNYEVEIRDLINQVRQRDGVDMPTIDAVEGVGLSQDELRQILRHERRVEFAFEGTRYNDIKRWDIGEEAISTGYGYRPELLDLREDVSVILTTCSYQGIQIDAPAMGFTKEQLSGIRKAVEINFEFEEDLLAVIASELGQDFVNQHKDYLIKRAKPAYFEVYPFRERKFKTESNYLWPIPIDEMQSNALIGSNNPGY